MSISANFKFWSLFLVVVLVISVNGSEVILEVFNKNSRPRTPLEYDRKYFDAISPDSGWSANLFGDVPNKVANVTGAYYDNNMVSKTGEWLAGDVTWVLGITRDVPWQADFNFALVSRTIHALNQYFYSDDETVRFGLVDLSKDELLKETLVGLNAPCIVVLRNGKLYKDAPFKEAYNKVFNFIENGAAEQDKEEGKATVLAPRIGIVKLYLKYWYRGLSSFQRKKVNAYLTDYARNENTSYALDWLFSKSITEQIIWTWSIILGFTFSLLMVLRCILKYLCRCASGCCSQKKTKTE